MSNSTSVNIFSSSLPSLVSGFIDSCAAFPNRPALFINERHYTYSELMQLATAIYLKINKSKQYKQIGVYCTHDVFSYAALLAVSMYGAAYVPLNPLFPIARTTSSIKECELEIILSAQALPAYTDESTQVVVCSTLDNSVSSKISVPEQISDNEYAYILFTSGSTGKPKGVPVSKKNTEAFFKFFLSNYTFNETDKFLQPYELTFDVSVFAMFMPWFVGACCYAVPQEGIKYLNIVKTLQQHKITVCSMVPTVLPYIEKYLHQLQLPDLRYSFFSGDALYQDLAVKWKACFPNGELHNFYGPTETTIVCTRYVWEENKSKAESLHNIVPLGLPFKGMEHLLVDEENKPVQENETGELCFSGDQVIPAYLHQSNEESFFAFDNKRYYKTGDMASLNKNGNLVFHGRKDTQVKINGYRVELAEVEHAIAGITSTNCVVLLQKDTKGFNCLIAFIDKAYPEKQLMEELEKRLPEYMLPKKIITLTAWPLSVNGKIDKRRLVESSW